jgi:hypothetical protein
VETEPNLTALVWFGLDDFLKTNRTKLNRIPFYLAVKITFIFKTEPNLTANTPDNNNTSTTHTSLLQVTNIGSKISGQVLKRACYEG